MTAINAVFFRLAKIPILESKQPGLCEGQRAQPGISAMMKTAYAVAVSAIAAAYFVGFPSLSPQVGVAASVAGAKADRVDCVEQAWPYFDAACMGDIRIVSADRTANSTQ